jgi:hypothetical protein
VVKNGTDVKDCSTSDAARAIRSAEAFSLSQEIYAGMIHVFQSADELK